jgi:hypothetical protein
MDRSCVHTRARAAGAEQPRQPYIKAWAVPRTSSFFDWLSGKGGLLQGQTYYIHTDTPMGDKWFGPVIATGSQFTTTTSHIIYAAQYTRFFFFSFSLFLSPVFRCVLPVSSDWWVVSAGQKGTHSHFLTGYIYIYTHVKGCWCARQPMHLSVLLLMMTVYNVAHPWKESKWT